MQGSLGSSQGQAAERWLTGDKTHDSPSPAGAARAASRVRAGGYRRQWVRQGVRSPHGVECPDTSTDRWGWVLGKEPGDHATRERMVPNGAMEAVVHREWGFKSLPQSG